MSTFAFSNNWFNFSFFLVSPWFCIDRHCLAIPIEDHVITGFEGSSNEGWAVHTSLRVVEKSEWWNWWKPCKLGSFKESCEFAAIATREKIKRSFPNQHATCDDSELSSWLAKFQRLREKKSCWNMDQCPSDCPFGEDNDRKNFTPLYSPETAANMMKLTPCSSLISSPCVQASVVAQRETERSTDCYRRLLSSAGPAAIAAAADAVAGSGDPVHRLHRPPPPPPPSTGCRGGDNFDDFLSPAVRNWKSVNNHLNDEWYPNCCCCCWPCWSVSAECRWRQQGRRGRPWMVAVHPSSVAFRKVPLAIDGKKQFPVKTRSCLSENSKLKEKEWWDELAKNEVYKSCILNLLPVTIWIELFECRFFVLPGA